MLTSELLLDRYGIVTRGSVQAEGIDGGFAGVYKVFSASEDAGRLRRGYFVEGLGAAQFATTGAIDRLRAVGSSEIDLAGPPARGLGARRHRSGQPVWCRVAVGWMPVSIALAVKLAPWSSWTRAN